MENNLIRCAACGQDDACQGHSVEVDPVGYAVLANHKVDDHLNCHPAGCKVAGRSVHAHSCMNCGEDAVCIAKVSNNSCEERTTICSNCLPKLARIEHLSDKNMLERIKERMRMRDGRGRFDNLTDATLQAAIKGAPLDAARGLHGDSRPSDAERAEDALDPRKSSKDLPDWIVDALDPTLKLASESGDSFVPPSSVASNAKRGLALRKKHNRGGTEVGVARARDLSNRKGLSYSTVKRMKAYFDRHEVDKKGEGWGKDSAGYIAWLLWGGDAGRSWANKIIKSKEKGKKESSIEVTSGDLIRVDFQNALREREERRKDRGDFTPEEVKTILNESAHEAYERIETEREEAKLRAGEQQSRQSLTELWEGIRPNMTPPSLSPLFYDQDADKGPFKGVPSKSTPWYKKMVDYLGLED